MKFSRHGQRVAVNLRLVVSGGVEFRHYVSYNLQRTEEEDRLA